MYQGKELVLLRGAELLDLLSIARLDALRRRAISQCTMQKQQ